MAARPPIKGTARLTLKRLMDKRGWSQVDLARESGVSQTHIGAILRGDSSCSIEVAEDLARPFGVSAQHLLTPELPDDLVGTPDIDQIIATYINATPAARRLIDAALEMARGKLPPQS